MNEFFENVDNLTCMDMKRDALKLKLKLGSLRKPKKFY